ncbi:hypothetical protein [Roseibium sp.]|uniref:hypothetical protein n=1 Tax=Roseibium sp. TaxID=1936156 RepID=UPI0032637958
MRFLIVAAMCSVFLAACAVTRPVVVIADNGEMLRGSATATLSGGSFEVSGKWKGKMLTCAGSYDSLDSSTTISMPVHCNDGRKGIVIATRQRSGLDGSGRVRLNDGTDADFVFGTAAEAL